MVNYIVNCIDERLIQVHQNSELKLYHIILLKIKQYNYYLKT